MAAITLNLVDRVLLRRKLAIQNTAGLVFFLSFVGFSVSNSFVEMAYVAAVLVFIIIISIIILTMSLLLPANVHFVGQAILTEDKLETIIGDIRNTYYLPQARLELATYFQSASPDSQIPNAEKIRAWNNFLLLQESDTKTSIKIELEPNKNIFDAKTLLKVESYNNPSFLTEDPRAWFSYF